MEHTIVVEPIDQTTCRVIITDADGSSSEHLVAVPREYAATFGYDTDDTHVLLELVHRSIEFLLAREPKESILAAFDLPVIERYFPEFSDVIPR